MLRESFIRRKCTHSGILKQVCRHTCKNTRINIQIRTRTCKHELAHIDKHAHASTCTNASTNKTARNIVSFACSRAQTQFGYFHEKLRRQVNEPDNWSVKTFCMVLKVVLMREMLEVSSIERS